MTTLRKQKQSDRGIRPSGEAYVWATGMGLSVALLMIVFLLGLILRNGIEVFWPKRVALITLREEGQTRFHGGTRMAGVVVLEKERDKRDLTESQLLDPDPSARREKKLFVGNRDVYGESFAYIGVGDIQELHFPRDIIMAERLEWGNAIFWPLELRLPDGRTISAEDESFHGLFGRLLAEARDRRTLINQIEKSQIGRINSEMRNLELEERFFLQQPVLSSGQQSAFERVRRRIAELREQYEPLAAQAGELRKQQLESLMRYRLATGEERSAPIGTFVHYHYPNDIAFWGRARLFLSNIWDFVSNYPREANTEGGIFPAIFGTVVMTLLMSIAVTPFGVVAAIYLREYARQGPFVRGVRIAVNNLAGVPSIVFGIFGLGFFVYLVGGTIDELFYPRALASNTPTFGTGGILWASLTLALMTVPVVIVATEEALAAVSRGVRDGSLACGASKWQTIQRLVLPASAPGILTGLILAMARGAGEVAPLILVGVVALAPNLPLDGNFPFIHLERKFMHLGFHIYDLGFQSPDSEAARPMVFATTLVLVLLVIVLNLAAIIIRNRLRKRYASARF
jgi:phosphate transport system permease protein